MLLAAAVAVGATGVQAPAVASTPPSVTIEGGGAGHGVGLSHWGSEGLARQGRTTAEILHHYFTGVTIEPGGPWPRPAVLIGSGTGAVELRPGGPTRLVVEIPGRPDPPRVRLVRGDLVRVGTSGTSLFVRVSGGAVSEYPSGTRLRVPVPKRRLDVRPDSRTDFLGWSSSETSRTYRHGTVEVSLDRGNREAACRGRMCTVVRNLGMQKYLLGLAEVPPSFGVAAQEVQAVLGRSFAAVRIANAREPGLYHLRADTMDQHYKGWLHHASNPRWVSAVGSTRSVVIKHRGQVAQGYYSASSGGHTESSSYVWSTQPGHLVAVADPADSIAPQHRWTRRYTLDEIGAWFGVADVRSVSIGGSVGASGRVDKASVQIVGSTTRSVTGNQFRATVNANAPDRPLWSTKFRITGVG
jgi:stage II sporulation protein D